AAVALGLERGALLAGVDRGIVAGLPNMTSKTAQILSDLHELARIGALPDGARPLRAWLEARSALVASRAEQEVCHEPLHALTAELWAEPAPLGSTASGAGGVGEAGCPLFTWIHLSDPCVGQPRSGAGHPRTVRRKLIEDLAEQLAQHGSR